MGKKPGKNFPQWSLNAFAFYIGVESQQLRGRIRRNHPSPLRFSPTFTQFNPLPSSPKNQSNHKFCRNFCLRRIENQFSSIKNVLLLLSLTTLNGQLKGRDFLKKYVLKGTPTHLFEKSRRVWHLRGAATERRRNLHTPSTTQCHSPSSGGGRALLPIHRKVGVWSPIDDTLPHFPCALFFLSTCPTRHKSCRSVLMARKKAIYTEKFVQKQKECLGFILFFFVNEKSPRKCLLLSINF